MYPSAPREFKQFSFHRAPSRKHGISTTYFRVLTILVLPPQNYAHKKIVSLPGSMSRNPQRTLM
jgi:hypothetical protein